MSMGYDEQIFVLTAAFNDAVKLERKDDRCHVVMVLDPATLEALEQLKKETKITMPCLRVEAGQILATFDLGFLDGVEPVLADLLRKKTEPRKIPASERVVTRMPFIPFIVK